MTSLLAEIEGSKIIEAIHIKGMSLRLQLVDITILGTLPNLLELDLDTYDASLMQDFL